MSSITSCISAAAMVEESSFMPAQTWAVLQGWWMKSSPLLRSWPACWSQAKSNALRIRSTSSFELYEETWPSNSWSR